jgi:hypothetical protein
MAVDSSVARFSTCLLAACAFMVWAPRPSFASVTIAQIYADLEKKGGRYVIDHYFEYPDAHAGADLVETGTREAVALGVKVMQHTDGGATTALQSSLAEALAKAPENVLPYVDTNPTTLAAKEICLPFLSAEEPAQKLRAIIERTRKSLLRVTARNLQRQKAACLREVEKNLALLR